MITPEFPYKSNQIIISSDRVTLHSKNDVAFILGKKMVAIASNETVNIDAKEKILLDSDKIELGSQAEVKGEPVVLGYKLVNILVDMVITLNNVGSQLAAVSKSGDAASWAIVQESGLDLTNMADRLLGLLSDTEGPRFLLSKNTYTR
jgi:hypothetical protein